MLLLSLFNFLMPCFPDICNCVCTLCCPGPSGHYDYDYDVNEHRYPYDVLRINKVKVLFFLLLFSVIRQYRRLNQSCYSTVQLWEFTKQEMFLLLHFFSTLPNQSPAIAIKNKKQSTHTHMRAHTKKTPISRATTSALLYNC